MNKDERKRFPRKIMSHGAGRPRIETARVAVGFRISPGLKKFLDAAAGQNARSLSQEMEHRLELTFKSDGIVREALNLAYGPTVAVAMFKYADTMRTMQIVKDMKERGVLDDAGAQIILEGCRKNIREVVDAEPGMLEEVK